MTAEPRTPPAEAGGDDAGRFEILDKLGSGGMGAVYRAFDRQRRIQVAVKTLLQPDGRAVYRFKREFRSLADISHRNLITLYELFTSGDEWFFTMELVEGVSFIDYVRPRVGPSTLIDRVPPPMRATVSDTGEMDPGAAPARAGDTPPAPIDPTMPLAGGSNRRPPRFHDGILDVARLEAALTQLADGLRALHEIGKLHRDLKPSNVLVERNGRVVVLDFGLTADRDTVSEENTHGAHGAAAVGTPMYMSPEQAADTPLTEASDWYSVGVMLYEALTGVRPFEEAGPDVLLHKHLHDPIPPRRLAAGVPGHLDQLCMRLLNRDPARRPDGDEVLAALGASASPDSVQMVSRQRREQVFVGRERELSVLRGACTASRGRAVSVYVRGPSGIGKSALINRFLDELSDDVVVLRGRCYERESVPHKALDAVVDALTRHLLSLPFGELEGLRPREVRALMRLFPSVKRVNAFAPDPGLAGGPSDLQEVRRRAFGALRYLLDRLAESQPVVVCIDDLQWGDVDSAGFLEDLILHPSPPHVLLVASYRSEDEESSPLLQSLAEARAATGGGGEVVVLTVTGLDADEATRLVEAVGGERDPALHAGLVRDAGGSPMFLTELARSVPADAVRGGLTLDRLLQDRITALPDAQRELIQTLAVAGRPMPAATVVTAAGLDGEGRALTALGKERLIRFKQGATDEILIEPFHDRIRRAAVATLDRDRVRATHRAMAVALEADDDSDPEALVEHWLGAGELDRVGDYAVRAAEAAVDTLAFHRAADFYELAIEHGQLDDQQRRALLIRRGQALVNAGRLDAAATTLGAAADGADPDTWLEVSRLQLEQLLRRGHMEEGMVLARAVLGRVGLSLPSSRAAALLSIVRQRVLLRLRGLAFEERSEDQVPAAVRTRLDVAWSVCSGLAFVDPLATKALQVRYAREALAAGEPRRVLRALSIELGYRAVAGTRTRAACEALHRVNLELSKRLDDPTLRGLVGSAAGVASYLSGHWAEAERRLTDAEEDMGDAASEARWEIDVTQIFRIATLAMLGRFRDLGKLLPIYLREARERGDVYAERGLRGWRGNVLWLARDRPDEALHHVEAVAMTSSDSFHLHHYYELVARTQIRLYQGQADDAWAGIAELGKRIKPTQLGRIQMVRMEGGYVAGRAALAAAVAAPASERARLLAVVDKRAAGLEREDTAWGDALAKLLRAMAAHQRGDDAGAVDLLRIAADGLAEVDMNAIAMVARVRLAALVGGSEGVALRARAHSWARVQGVVRLAALADLYAPGFTAT